MKKLAMLSFTAAMLLSPVSISAATTPAGASATDVCRHVRYLIIAGSLYEEVQCIIYTSGRV